MVKLTKIKRTRFGIANFVSYFVELLVKSFDLTANLASSERQNSLILNLFQPPSAVFRVILRAEEAAILTYCNDDKRESAEKTHLEAGSFYLR